MTNGKRLPWTTIHRPSPIQRLAEHAEEFIASRGAPLKLTVDRSSKIQQRAAALRGVPRITGKDRDEFPPSLFEEGGINASVRHIDPGDNRGAGSSMMHQLKDVKDGEVVEVEVIKSERK